MILFVIVIRSALSIVFTGVCLPGWVGHRGNCWQFNAQYKLNFQAAVNFCKQQGAQLAKIARYFTY